MQEAPDVMEQDAESEHGLVQEAEPEQACGNLSQRLRGLMHLRASWIDLSRTDVLAAEAIGKPQWQRQMRRRWAAVAGLGATASAVVIVWSLSPNMLGPAAPVRQHMVRVKKRRLPPALASASSPPAPPTLRPPPPLRTVRGKRFPHAPPPPPPPLPTRPPWPSIPPPPDHPFPKPPPTAPPPPSPWPPDPPPPPSRPDGPLVERLNARFRRAPWSQHWYRWGALADAGILIHVTDGLEQNGAPWAPATDGPGATDMSASLVFAANYVRGKSIPLFGSGKKSAGLIFRPGVTFVRCGKAVDSAGQCGGWCWNTQGEWSEADDKLCTWPPQHFGTQLHRLTDYQVKHGRLFYNEIIIDAPSWRSHLPGVIEGIYGDREMHRAFVAEYGLDEATFPLLHLDPMNWESPFSRA
eukprot:Transcript_20373.p1 GENE.Transcript_20373~~Transcript_20373.p1  ORF type:complete len:446 (+),score=11.32 Transcript_20373:111-1340(+)